MISVNDIIAFHIPPMDCLLTYKGKNDAACG
jgi:hypothetical protein